MVALSVEALAIIYMFGVVGELGSNRHDPVVTQYERY